MHLTAWRCQVFLKSENRISPCTLYSGSERNASPRLSGRHPPSRTPRRLAPLAALLVILMAASFRIARSLPTFAQSAPSLDYPQLIDITASNGIHFDHHSSPEQKFIVESMSDGVALIDYDRDGGPDIYFTNAQTVDMAKQGIKSRSALFHNNHDGTFTDVTGKAGVGYPCWANGVAVGDYNNERIAGFQSHLSSVVKSRMPMQQRSP